MRTTQPIARRLFCLGLCASLSSAWRAARAGSGAGAHDAPLPLLLAKDLAPGTDPTGYLVSEKFDGVRAVWDGTRLRFRSGRTVPAPDWFVGRLPKQALDGELWMARGRFEQLSGAVRAELPDDATWRQIKYLVFELPGAPGSFAERAAGIWQVVAAAAWPALVAVEQSRVADLATLQQRLAEVVRRGGEGLVLHRADAPYQTGRSEVLQKLKPLDDAEAQVVAHQGGQGKYRGRLGALVVRTAQGRDLRIGTGFSDAERAEPPPVGSFVTFTYRGLTRTGAPRFASFLRRHDAP